MSQDLHGIQHQNMDVQSPNYFHEAADFFYLPQASLLDEETVAGVYH
jgi:hypothetical protein